MEERRDNSSGPLAGIKVVDVSSAVAGPWVSSWLAEFGADVVFVEKVGTPDVMRMTGATSGDQSGCWVHMHRNKRGMDLDVRSDVGRDILMQLVSEADVFIQNFRPGVAERLKIAYPDFASVNPDLIYLSVSGFGADGPYVDLAGLVVAVAERPLFTGAEVEWNGVQFKVERMKGILPSQVSLTLDQAYEEDDPTMDADLQTEEST